MRGRRKTQRKKVEPYSLKLFLVSTPVTLSHLLSLPERLKVFLLNSREMRLESIKTKMRFERNSCLTLAWGLVNFMTKNRIIIRLIEKASG